MAAHEASGTGRATGSDNRRVHRSTSGGSQWLAGQAVCLETRSETGREQGSMRILIACEFSGIVRDAFTRKGHTAISCDLAASESAGLHIQGSVEHLLNAEWDLMIAFPPCTYLSRAGAHLWSKRQLEQQRAAEFVATLWAAPIPHVAIENPIGRLNQLWRYPDQTVQPWWFGHPVTKATNLWLRGLPTLEPSNVVTPAPGRLCWTELVPGGRNQARNRSRTFKGLAEAMADQWSNVNQEQKEVTK